MRHQTLGSGPPLNQPTHASIVIFRTDTLHGHLRATGLVLYDIPNPKAFRHVAVLRLAVAGVTCLDPGSWGNRRGSDNNITGIATERCGIR